MTEKVEKAEKAKADIQSEREVGNPYPTYDERPYEEAKKKK